MRSQSQANQYPQAFFRQLPDIDILILLIKQTALRLFRKKRRGQQASKIKRTDSNESPPLLGERFIPPGVNSQVFNGFVSSPHNPRGMQAEFHYDQHRGVVCQWNADKAFEGYPQTLHGGISFAVLDELLAYAVFEQYQTYAVTVASKIKWRGKIKIGTTVCAKAVVKKRFWRFVKVKGWIVNQRGRTLVEMTGTLYIPSKREFKNLVDLSIMPEEALPYCGLD